VKPSKFAYVRPDNLTEALEAKSAFDDTVVLAGGQSLIPTLNFRLSNPEAVIDIGSIEGLESIAVGDRWVRLGAMARQRDVELHPGAQRANRLLTLALEHVAHPVIRNRGTVAGSIAHADPSAELPCALLALGGEVVATSRRGERTVPAESLFEFVMTTSLEPDELITEVRFPVLDADTGVAFAEFSRRHGDFALAGVAVVLRLDAATVQEVSIAACGVAATPVRLTSVEEALTGREVTPTAVSDAVRFADDYVTSSDTDISLAYRRHLLRGLIEEAVQGAARYTQQVGERVPA
jgi:carbon-monoxide dehydrogenase medium subunit